MRPFRLSRLNTSHKFMVASGSGRRSLESSGGRKRKLVDVEGDLNDSYKEYSSSSSTGQSFSKGVIQIVEVDGDGKFVRLQNSTDKAG